MYVFGENSLDMQRNLFYCVFPVFLAQGDCKFLQFHSSAALASLPGTVKIISYRGIKINPPQFPRRSGGVEPGLYFDGLSILRSILSILEGILAATSFFVL